MRGHSKKKTNIFKVKKKKKEKSSLKGPELGSYDCEDIGLTKKIFCIFHN